MCFMITNQPLKKWKQIYFDKNWYEWNTQLGLSCWLSTGKMFKNILNNFNSENFPQTKIVIFTKKNWGRSVKKISLNL